MTNMTGFCSATSRTFSHNARGIERVNNSVDSKSICSSQHLFEVEIGKLKRLFYNNNYPTWFSDKIYNKFKASVKAI